MKTMERMSLVLLIAIVGGLAWTLPAVAEKIALSDDQLDQVSAGTGSGMGYPLVLPPGLNLSIQVDGDFQGFEQIDTNFDISPGFTDRFAPNFAITWTRTHTDGPGASAAAAAAAINALRRKGSFSFAPVGAGFTHPIDGVGKLAKASGYSNGISRASASALALNFKF